MTESEMEKTIDGIVELRWKEMFDTNLDGMKNRLKMAVCDAYKAGLEAARKAYTS